MLGLLDEASWVLLPSGRLGLVVGRTDSGDDIQVAIQGDPDGAEFSPVFEVELPFACAQARGIH